MTPAERLRSSRTFETAGSLLRRVELWGVLNVTPDSFSDGGLYGTVDAALDRARAMRAQGADRIDVGGESSRPAGRVYGAGFAKISADEERSRVIPVIEGLASEGFAVSVDTTKAEVARAALEAGANVVNDVSCGRSDELLAAVAEFDAELVLMHTRGDGQVTAPHTDYEDLVADVIRELGYAVSRATRAGVQPSRIWLDPGVGFAKTPAQSAALIAATADFVASGHRILVGASRKSFIAALTAESGASPAPPCERLGGSIAAATAAVLAGAHGVRAHDIDVTRQAIDLATILRERVVSLDPTKWAVLGG